MRTASSSGASPRYIRGGIHAKGGEGGRRRAKYFPLTRPVGGIRRKTDQWAGVSRSLRSDAGEAMMTRALLRLRRRSGFCEADDRQDWTTNSAFTGTMDMGIRRWIGPLKRLSRGEHAPTAEDLKDLRFGAQAA